MGEDEGTERNALQALIFLGIVSVIIISTSLLIGSVYSLIFTQNMSVRWYYIAAMVAASVFVLLTEFVAYVNHRRWMFPLYALSSIIMGAFFYMFLTTVIGGLVLLAGIFFGLHDNGPFMLLVREFVILGVALPVIWGLIEGRMLLTRELEVPMKNYRGKGVRIALISDVHLGLLVGKHRLGRIIRNLRKYEPDIIVAAGDIIDTNPRFLGHLRKMIMEIPKIAPTYFVVGNHEFYHGYSDSKEFMSELGYNVMDNRSVRDNRTGLTIAGVDDPSAFGSYDEYREKIDELVKGAPKNEPLLFVNHQPLHFRMAAEEGVGLMLSGHTHNGQMFPAGFVTKMVFKDGHKGLNRHGDSYLYVCVGSGTWGPPIRVGAPSEIAIIDLKEP